MPRNIALTAKTANARPSANVTRPTATLVAVPTANHTAETSAARGGSSAFAIAVKAQVAATELTTATTATPSTAPSGGNSRL